jgi:hypothetical protein
MRKILLTLAVLFTACIPVETEVPTDSGVVGMDSSILQDSGIIHEHDTGVSLDSSVDSSVVKDSGTDSGHNNHIDASVKDAGKDSSMPVDSGHNHTDGMVMQDTGIVEEDFPVGHPGYSTLRVRNTTEQPENSGEGAFRIQCAYSHMNYDDPIVYPGQKGVAHLHTYFGNKTANYLSTYDSLMQGASTCDGGIMNRTAYWIPTLLKDGKPFAPTYAIFYYKTGFTGIPLSSIQPMPAGLKILAGYPNNSDKANWGCRDNYIGWFDTIQDCPSGDLVLAEIRLPQCWDGRNLDSTDHRSHMAYTNSNRCPSTHPVAIPEISVVIGWPTDKKAGLILSSDIMFNTAPGQSLHSDWMDGWDPSFPPIFVEKCIRANVSCHAHLVGDGRSFY